ncbi:hypothetical protein GJ744_000103 [Endocarpon pusillum]|uniref:Uncharacterized protein n=1 Tax=Endocarpon pusillum TaxID=364733 RepID=A0A8H7EAJ4_9EURO|nr:hypothetical protein GJ744_000103 [Endocarpon pusillum]
MREPLRPKESADGFRILPNSPHTSITGQRTQLSYENLTLRNLQTGMISLRPNLTQYTFSSQTLLFDGLSGIRSSSLRNCIYTAGLLIAVLQLAENMSTDSMPMAY